MSKENEDDKTKEEEKAEERGGVSKGRRRRKKKELPSWAKRRISPLDRTREKDAVTSMTQSRLNRMIAQARECYDAKKYREAVEIGSRIYRLDAAWLENLLLLGSAHVQLQNYSESIFYLQQAIRVDPFFAEAYSNLGNALKELGDTDGCVQAYLKAIKLKPRFADAYNNLAVSYAQMGQIDQAIETFQMAIVIRPAFAEAHSNIGNMYKVKGSFEEAKKAYHEAIRVDPTFAVAWSNLGGIYKEERDFERAIAHYKEAIRLVPEFADAYSNLGAALKEAGMIQEAKQAYGEALRLRPDFAVAHGNLGNCYFEEGKKKEAIKCFKLAIQLEPHFPDAYNNLGNVLRECGDVDEAITSYRMALRLKTDHPHAYNNLGNALRDKGLLKEAKQCFMTACRLMPRFPEAQNNLGSLLKEQGKHLEAIAHFEEALAADPDFAEAFSNMGCAYKDLQMTEEAIQCFMSAIKIRPTFPNAYCCLAGCFREVGRVSESILCYEKALKLRSDYPLAIVRLWDAHAQIAQWGDEEERQRRLKVLRRIVKVEQSEGSHAFPIIEPFSTLIHGYSLEEAKTLAAKHSMYVKLTSIALTEGHTFRFRAKKPRQRLRIGWVSSHFGNHPVGHALLHTIANHDRSRFEVSCYALRPDDESRWRRRYEQSVEHFVDVSQMTNIDVARKIHEDGIHILIDLNGYTKGARHEVMALRAAPVQVQYLGFPGTMGTDYIDYVLTDKVACPMSFAEHFTEKIVHLPRSFLVSDHKHLDETTTRKIDNAGDDDDDARPTRYEEGLPDDKCVMACFAQHQKICPEVFSCWCRVLKKCPNTVLWLLAWTEEGQKNLLREAETRGVKRSQIVFSKVIPKREHLKRCYLADLYVDTTTMSSMSSICDVLWSCTPAVSMAGPTMASRSSASALHSVGLEKNVVNTIEGYESLIVRLASDRKSLLEMRETLRSNRDFAPLFDTTGAARAIEKAMILIWRKHEWGEAHDHITVPEKTKPSVEV